MFKTFWGEKKTSEKAVSLGSKVTRLFFEEDVFTPNFSSFLGSPPGELMVMQFVFSLPTTQQTTLANLLLVSKGMSKILLCKEM